MTSKVPTVTISLVRSEVHRRGWEESGTDDETMRYRRGPQRLTVSLASLRSTKFQMRNFMKELDLLDKHSR